jgi:hypothetical protein
MRKRLIVAAATGAAVAYGRMRRDVAARRRAATDRWELRDAEDTAAMWAELDALGAHR